MTNRIYENGIYETPNGEWKILKQRDLTNQWDIYTAWKKIGGEWAFRFLRYELKDVFKKLCEYKIISKDEMDFQIGKIQPLTDEKE